MSPRQKNINIIHNCEKHFFNWLTIRLMEMGVTIESQHDLSEILLNHEKELGLIHQHLKPLQKWSRIKDECFSRSSQLNGNAESDEYLGELLEKTAFDGQVLWLTLQEG